MTDESDESVYLQQQELPLASQQSSPRHEEEQPSSRVVEHTKLRSFLVRLLPFLLILLGLYLVGPAIFQAHKIKAWALASNWEAQARTQSVKRSAASTWLIALPLFILTPSLIGAWTWCFTWISGWSSLPLYAWIGTPSLWPLTPATLLFRWGLAFLFLPYPLALAWIMLLDDREAYVPQRVLLPDEVLRLKTAPTATESRAAPKQTTRKKASKKQARVSRAATKTPSTQEPPTTTPVTSDTSTEGALTRGVTPKSNSLWGGIDWEQVSDEHPLKQAAHEEARRTTTAPPPQQNQTPPPTDPTPLSKRASSSPPPPAPEEDVYDWNKSDGTLPL
jgi:hypothetical protein